jgi:hypothetical protein
MPEAGEQAFLRAKAIQWCADEPLPGLVEVELLDADEKPWRFVDKAPIFDPGNALGPATAYPVELNLACTIIEWTDDHVVVSTASPWGIESIEGRSQFVLRSDQVTVTPPD